MGDGALPEDGTLIAALNAGGSTLPVWSCLAMGLISELHQDPVAWSLTVFREAKAPARGWMMRFFHGPGEARDAILHVGLDDRSKRVRLWACEGTEHSHDRKRWLPRLALMRQSDPALEVREAAQHSHDIIDKGYRVNLKGGRWCFLVENQVGSIVACDFDEVAYRSYGEETLARMLMTRDSRLSDVEREMNDRRTAAG
ncbi:MAG: hypothetical protein GC200_08875 [Tepidisphaera sp.]|nr:hypothetical protein [Tepidisphaera sp.]